MNPSQGWAPSQSGQTPPPSDTETTAEARIPRPAMPLPSPRAPESREQDESREHESRGQDESREQDESDPPVLPVFPGAQPWEVPEDDAAPYDWFAGATDPEHRAREAAPEDVTTWTDEPPVPYATDEQAPWGAAPVVPGAPSWEPPPAFTAAAAGMRVWPAPVADPPVMPSWPAATGEPVPGLDEAEASEPDRPGAQPDRPRPGPPGTEPDRPRAGHPATDSTAPHPFGPNTTTPDPVGPAAPAGISTPGHPRGGSDTPAVQSPASGASPPPGQHLAESATPAGPHPTASGETTAGQQSAGGGTPPVQTHGGNPPAGQPTEPTGAPPSPQPATPAGAPPSSQPSTPTGAPPSSQPSTPTGAPPSPLKATAPGRPHLPAPGDIPVWPPAPRPTHQSDTGPMPVADLPAPASQPAQTPPATSGSKTWPPRPQSKGEPPTPPPSSPTGTGTGTPEPVTPQPDAQAATPGIRNTSDMPAPAGAEPTAPEDPGAGSPASPSGNRPSTARSELRASSRPKPRPSELPEVTGPDTQPTVLRSDSWPPAPQTEEQRQEEQLPELPFSPEVWGQKPAPARVPMPLQPAAYDLPTPPQGPTVHPPVAFPQQPGQPPAAKQPGKSRQALFATLGVLVLAGVATGGFFAYKSLSTPPPPAATATQPPAPTVTATSAPPTTAEPSPPAAAMLNSEDTDPRKLSLSEAFPKKKVAAGGAQFARVKTHLEPKCAKAASGPFAEALSDQKCSRVLRATYVDTKRRYAVTTGIAVLPTRDAALRADETKNLSRNLWFRALPGPAGTGGERVHIAGGYAAGLVWGRYIVFSYATYADGHTPAAKDRTLGKVSDAFRDQMSLVLERRIAGG
ncbi:hypothetical protein [Nonomuraea cavernae]|uniref:hypothetical protein n=1 Tax=Nonomuraea cavernae TaxID=2045107 RepID=UPI00166A9734|nr:hypothetical protein [Nonomuraea cavernae]MCA2188593.1 hypothetical protein [Nonomuraea cavernae]